MRKPPASSRNPHSWRLPVAGFHAVVRAPSGHRSLVPLVTMDSILEAVAARGVRTKNGSLLSKGLPIVHAIKLDVEGFEARVFMGGARLMARELRPKLIIMELFVHRMGRCRPKDFFWALGMLNYTLDVSPRLNMNFCKRSVHVCNDMTTANGKLGNFLKKLGGRAEMDLVFTLRD